MDYTIYRGPNPVLTIRPTGQQTKKLMDVSVVQLEFELPEAFDLAIGDTVTVFGEVFTLNVLPSVQKKSSIQYQYSCQFEAEAYNLAKILFMMLGDDNTLKEAEFALMGNALTFMQLVARNANRISPGWTLGAIADTEFKNLTFNQENCLQVLGRLATEFKTEFWIEGKTLYLSKKGQVSSLVFEYGKGKGLYGISRQNVNDKNICTRLYVSGSTKNIPGTYRNYSNRLKLPFLAPDNVTVMNGTYLERNAEFYGIIEHSETFEAVYPHRRGKVTAVGESFLSFYDEKLPTEFNLKNQLLPGITAKVSFHTGQLAGYEFEINDYNHSTGQIKINKNELEKALEVPSVLLRPMVGDEYVLFDILMPESYVRAAEVELYQKAVLYLDQNSSPRVLYSVICDPLHFKRQKITINLGDYIRVVDAALHIDREIRVIGFTRALDNAYAYQLELSDVVTVPSIVRQYAQQEEVERVILFNRLQDVNKSRMNWKNGQELINVTFDPEGNYFTEKIKPLVVETMNLTVGTKSGQFILRGVIFAPNFEADVNRFAWTAGFLDHYAIADQPITWAIPSGEAQGLDPATPYYIYIKCNRLTADAVVVIAPDKILVTSDPAMYYFPVGVLHSVVDGVRGISLTYGMTTVNGRFITTGMIQSQNGLTYFDLDTGTIGGNIMFGNRGTSTVIDGNLVQGGTMLLGNQDEGATVGMTGEGAADAIAFWAGADFENRETAPFRVYKDGRVFMSNATIEAKLIAKTGRIGNWNIDEYGLVNRTQADSYMIVEKDLGGGNIVRAAVGTNIFSVTSGIRGLAHFVNMEPNFGINHALIAEAKNGGQNIAAWFKGGTQMDGAQYHHVTKTGERPYYVQPEDCIILYIGDWDADLYLPEFVTANRVLEIKRVYNRRLTIHGNGKTIYTRSPVDRYNSEWYERLMFDGLYWNQLR